MPRAKKLKTEKQIFLELQTALRMAVREPDISRYEPHEKQYSFHSSEAVGRQFLGGNRSGKTTGGAAEAIWYLSGTHPYKKLPWRPPVRGRIVTTDLTEGLHKIILPRLKQFVTPSMLINGSWEDSWDSILRTLTFDNGSEIEILTYEMDLLKFAGVSRHFVWFDEEPPKPIYTECRLRLLDVGGHWWMTMTPTDGMTWTYDDIYSKRDIEEYIEVFEVDMDDNPHLGTEEKKQALAGLSDDEILARKKGQYIPTGGFIYKAIFDQVKSTQIIDPIDPRELVTWLWVGSMDHGSTNPTSWHWTAIDKEGRKVVFDEYYKSGEIVQFHAGQVNSINEKHGRPPEYNVGDPSIKARDAITGTSVQLEYMNHGIPVLLGDNGVISGIDLVKKNLLNKSLYICRNCPNLIWELERYRWAPWKNKKMQFEKNKKEEPQKKDDHAVDDLRYMIASRPEIDDGTAIPEIDYTAISSSVAVDPHKGIVDRELTMASRPAGDYHMGEEY